MIRKLSTWSHLAAAFLAIAAALSFLPACGEDSGRDSRSQVD